MSKFIAKVEKPEQRIQAISQAAPASSESGQLSLASVSELIMSLKPSLSTPESHLRLISNFLAQQYTRGVARPDVLTELCKNKDSATNAIEKRVGMFIEKLITGQEKHALKIARERVGRISKETVENALKEAVFSKAVQLTAGLGPIRPQAVQSALVGFGCIDGLLAYSNILLQNANSASDYKEITGIVDSLNELDKDILKSKSFALIKEETTGFASDKNPTVGKTLESNVAVSPDLLLSMLKANIDNIIGTLVKKTPESDNAILETLRHLTPSVLSLMSHPLLVAPFATKCLSSKNPEIQDQSLTTVLCLISRYSFDMPDFHSRLYDLAKYRKTLSLPLLKLLELSLKSAELPSVTVIPFIKVRESLDSVILVQVHARVSWHMRPAVVTNTKPAQVKRRLAGCVPGPHRVTIAISQTSDTVEFVDAVD